MQSILFSFAVIFCVCILHNVPQTYAVSILDAAYFVNIEMNGNNICSGFIMDDYYVLTSKTCTSQMDLATQDVRVRAGSSKLSFRGHVLPVVDIQPDDQLGSDLALVKVAIPFQYDPHIMWTNIDNMNMTEGLEGVMPVWAEKTKGSSLRLAKAEVINNNTCADILSDYYTIDDTMACVMPTISYAQACKAYPGTPFYYQERVFGVVTYNPGCDNDSLPLVMSVVGNFGSFILSKMCGIENINV